MLVITRRIEEAVFTDNGVTVKVLGIQGNHVKLGFTAPGDVGIHRAEMRRTTKDTKHTKGGIDGGAR